MDLLTISVAMLGIALLLLALSVVRSNTKRNLAIAAAKERKRTRNIMASIQPIYTPKDPAEPIVYDTTTNGLEVSNLTEEQANAIRAIFESDNHDKYIKKSENWVVTEKMPL